MNGPLEYSPLEIFTAECRYEVKLIPFKNPQTWWFSDISEIFFQILTLDKKKLHIDFDVHINYKLC